MMKKRTARKSCCILFSVVVVIAPVIQAADQESVLYAKAIGAETTLPSETPKRDAKPTKPGEKVKPVNSGKSTAEKTPKAAVESKPLLSKTAIWIGVGVAALLALAGGGGGGGGGGDSSTPPHP